MLQEEQVPRMSLDTPIEEVFGRNLESEESGGSEIDSWNKHVKSLNGGRQGLLSGNRR